MADGAKKRKELESKVLEKVGEVISSIKNAKQVDQVICALHSLAVLLFPVDSSLLSGSIDEQYREQVQSANILPENERSKWWHAFYKGAAFSTLSRVLLHDLASNWLACFPFSARQHVYDIFFVNGLATEVVQILVPCLQHRGSNGVDINAVRSNTERLLVLYLLENDGMLKIAREFGISCQTVDFKSECFSPAVSTIAQIVASIPDKLQLRASKSLSSHIFFKHIAIQLLSLAEGDVNAIDNGETLSSSDFIGTLTFVGDTFARVCRRGSADVLVNEIIPRISTHVHYILSLNIDSSVSDRFESNPGSQFWLKLMETIKDNYAVERISEEFLYQLATKQENDVEAYWILWLFFHRTFINQRSVRSMFVDKFLLWKVFPIRCLRWLLQFAVFQCPPYANCLKKGCNTQSLLDTLQHLAMVWSKREFVQSATLEQQAYISAAFGLCLELMSKEELDETRDVMHSILQGVSNRLENPSHLIRKMASSVALVFSKVIDPKNPLYLDDTCSEDTVDWEFGLATHSKGHVVTTDQAPTSIEETRTSIASFEEKNVKYTAKDEMGNDEKSKNKKISEFKLIDPDEIIDPATLNIESISDQDNDDNASEKSDTTSDSSLQPYDLSDDDTDLKRKFSHLVDVVGALQKPDDADGVEEALDVVEKLVRASPDELRHVARDLARTLVQVRCTDMAVEGEEESAENKRQRALVALLVTCPIESLDALNNLLYSPNVDISQRIMILDIMTEAAQELANAKTMKLKNQTRTLIATTSETQPWFLPSSDGPPGAGPWKEISETETLLNWSNRFERELPMKPGQIKRGKTRRWSIKSVNNNIQDNQMQWSHNKFPLYAAAFMLPAMQGFDKKRHGVDLLGRDFIVLGKLIYMLGVCMRCAAMHPEASALAPPLLDMLRSSDVCNHKEAYVRRAVLFAASCVLAALHPSYVVSSLVEGNLEISEGLEWVRAWALDVTETDTDRECYTMAMSCLQLHAEMALQAARALESTDRTFKANSVSISSNLSKGTIKIPYSDVKY